MSKDDEQKRDEVLKRLLETPPKPHKESGGEPKSAPEPDQNGKKG